MFEERESRPGAPFICEISMDAQRRFARPGDGARAEASLALDAGGRALQSRDEREAPMTRIQENVSHDLAAGEIVATNQVNRSGPHGPVEQDDRGVGPGAEFGDREVPAKPKQ